MTRPLLALLLLPFLALAAEPAPTPAPAAPVFTLDILCDNAQVDRLVIGCHPDATPAQDPRLDIPVPPFAIDTATVGLRPATPTAPILYRDLRPTTLPQTWHLDVTNTTKRLVRLSWNPAKLPQGVTLTIRRPDGRIANMRQASACPVFGNGTATITAASKP